MSEMIEVKDPALGAVHGPAKAGTGAIWAGMICIYIAWGSTYLAMRFAIQTMPPFSMAAARFLIAGGLLYGWQRLSGVAAPTRRQWRSALIVGLFLLLGGNGLVVWSEQRVPSGIAALMVGSTPLWMVLIDGLRQRRLPSGRVALGILIGLVGMAVLVGPSQLTGLHGDIDPVGAALLTLAALSWAAGSLYSRKADLPQSPFLYNGMEMLCGGGALLLLGSFTGEWSLVHLASISSASWLGFAYLVVFGSLIGFSTYTWLLRSAPTTLVSTYAYVNPIVAVIIGNLLAQEPLTPRVLLAAAVIVGGVVLITLSGSKK
jgi:drug/metabolite transporter (DMT)-like permease